MGAFGTFRGVGGGSSTVAARIAALNPAFWSLPSDTARQVHRYGAEILGTGVNVNYLSTAAHADFDFTASTFSVAFSHNPSGSFVQAGNPYVDRTFIGHGYVAANGSGWHIRAGGSTGQAQRVQFICAITNANYTATATRTTNDSALAWSRCVVTFNAGAVLIYLDGVEYTAIAGGAYVDSGTMPANVYYPSTYPFSIGKAFYGTGRDAHDIIHDVRVWKGRVLTAAEVKRDWNGGDVKHYADMSVHATSLRTSCVAAWDLDNSLDDATAGAKTLAVTGSAPFVPMVLEHREKSANGYQLFPIKSNAVGNYTERAYAAAPRYLPTGINSTPCHQYRFNHSLYTKAALPFNNLTADIFEVVYYPDALAGTEQFTWMSADETESDGAGRYFGVGWQTSGTNKPGVRIKDVGNSAGDGMVLATFTLAAATVYLINWRVLGTGGDASFECRINGVAQAVTYTVVANKDKGPSSVTLRDNLSIASLTRTSGPSENAINVRIGEQIVFSPGLSVEQNRMVEALVAAGAGITLP